MLKKLSHKNKSVAIFAGFFLFLFIGYKLSFSKTFELRNEISAKEDKLAWLKEKEKEIPFLQSKMNLIEKFCNNDSSSVRDKLTSFISDFAEQNNCVVTEIPSFNTYKHEDISIQTNRFVIKGNFKNLLTILFELEKNNKLNAKVMSAKFFTSKDMLTKRKSLSLTLITQSFKQDNLKGVIQS